jgi:hypothetical protein
MKQLIVGMALLGLAGPALAARWQVEVTNVTPGQTFTPILAATHYGNVTLFELGAPPSAELATLAEAGDTAPMKAALQADGRVRNETCYEQQDRATHCRARRELAAGA